MQLQDTACHSHNTAKRHTPAAGCSFDSATAGVGTPLLDRVSTWFLVQGWLHCTSKHALHGLSRHVRQWAGGGAVQHARSHTCLSSTLCKCCRNTVSAVQHRFVRSLPVCTCNQLCNVLVPACSQAMLACQLLNSTLVLTATAC